MKYPKMLGLAAIAATALTALVGVGNASAITLCENNQATGCTSHVNSGATWHFSATASGKWTGPFGIVLSACTTVTIGGSTSNTGADDTTTAVTGTVATLTFEGCTRKTTVGTGGTISIAANGTAGNGSVVSNGTTVTIHELPNITGNPATCAYITSNTSLGTLTASATAATFDASATINSETANCPNATWHGTFVVTGTVIRAIAH
jgi:hypothetical protein